MAGRESELQGLRRSIKDMQHSSLERDKTEQELTKALQAEGKELERKASELEGDLTVALEDLASQVAQRQAKERALAVLRSEMDDQTWKATRLEKQIVELEEVLQRREQTVTSMRSSNEDLMKQKRALSQQLHASELRKLALDDEVEMRKGRSDKLEQHVRGLEQELTAQESLQKTLKETVHDLELKVSALEADILEAGRASEKSETSYKAGRDIALAGMKEERDDKARKIENLQKLVEKQDAAIKEIDKQLELETGKSEELSKQKRGLAQQLDAAQ
eukprot:1477324-Rhodomonas_salina.1